jgi:hypothetical protein
MSRDSGDISVEFSKNFHGDLNQLVKSLNRFQWTALSDRWTITGNEENPLLISIFDDEQIFYPTSMPEKRCGIVVNTSIGTQKAVYRISDELIFEALSKGYPILTKRCSLEEIANVIAPAIYKGSIEINSNRNVDVDLVLHESLYIDSKHEARFKAYLVGSDVCGAGYEESYGGFEPVSIKEFL